MTLLTGTLALGKGGSGPKGVNNARIQYSVPAPRERNNFRFDYPLKSYRKGEWVEWHKWVTDSPRPKQYAPVATFKFLVSASCIQSM